MAPRPARSAWLFLLVLLAACAGRSGPDRGASNSGSDGARTADGRLRVLLVAAAAADAPSRPYLEMALLAGDELELDKLTPQDFDARVAGRSLPRYAVIVLDGHTPAALPPPPVRLLYFRPAGGHSPFPVRGEIAGASVTRVRQDHEVVRGVTFADARLDHTAVLEVDPRRGELVLAAAGADAVIAARSSAQGRTIACGFRPSDTAWVLQSTFAVFIHNAVAWLAAAPSGR